MFSGKLFHVEATLEHSYAPGAYVQALNDHPFSFPLFQGRCPADYSPLPTLYILGQSTNDFHEQSSALDLSQRVALAIVSEP